MNTINQQLLAQALQVCADEPIHQIGNIQPHGAALVLSADSLRTVLQASANINQFIDFSTEDVLGKPLAELLGEASAQRIESLIKSTQTQQCVTGLISVAQQQLVVELDVTIYSSDAFWVVELCQDSGLPKSEKLGELLMHTQNALLSLESDNEPARYFEEISRFVQALTGYDSVMIYRFKPNWDGEVIAQSHTEAAPCYQGLSFPASDIPVQARTLYLKNRVRIVTDVKAKPVSVLPTLNPVSQQPLDMTHSVLRSLSPIHLEYLGNMGVQASMVISLLQNGRLWGLISCHHLTPKRVSFAMRDAAVFISRMVSSELTSIEIKAEHKLLDKASQIKMALLDSIITQTEAKVIEQFNPDLLDLVGASGLIIVVEGKRYLQGQMPEPDAIDGLLDWLGKQPITDVFSCDHLSEQFPPASTYKESVSGVIATALSSDMRNCLVWLRKEKTQPIKWAGRYEQGLVQTSAGNYQLNPRNSFESWTELAHGLSTPWSPLEIKIVKAFRPTLSKGLAEKNIALLIENKRAELLERLQKMTSRLPGVIYQFRLQPDGRSCLPYASQGIQDIFKVTPEDVREDASRIFALIHPDDYEAMWLSIQQSAQNLKPWNHEFRVKFADGTVSRLLGDALPEQEADGVTLWHGFITDITERKQAEMIFRSVFDQSSFLAGILDQNGRLVEVNSSAVLLSNASREALIGQYFPDTPWWSNAQDRAKLIEVLALAYQGTVASFEGTHPTANGGHINVLFSAMPIARV